MEKWVEERERERERESKKEERKNYTILQYITKIKKRMQKNSEGRE